MLLLMYKHTPCAREWIVLSTECVPTLSTTACTHTHTHSHTTFENFSRMTSVGLYKFIFLRRFINHSIVMNPIQSNIIRRNVCIFVECASHSTGTIIIKWCADTASSTYIFVLSCSLRWRLMRQQIAFHQ